MMQGQQNIKNNQSAWSYHSNVGNIDFLGDSIK
jgi:hypothetical protein